MEACPQDSTNRSRSGHFGSSGSWFMIRVHSTWASGARAIAVPLWPELAFSGASMARPRITLIPSCSTSLVDPVWLTSPTVLKARGRTCRTTGPSTP